MLIGHGPALGVERTGSEDAAVVRALPRNRIHRPGGGVGPLRHGPGVLDRGLTAVELRILPVTRVPIELLDGVAKHRHEVRVEPRSTGVGGEPLEAPIELDGEVLERVRLDDVVPLAMVGGHRPSEHGLDRALHERLVPDHEHEEVRVLAEVGVPLEVELTPLVVRGLLVQGAATVLVDHDHAVAERRVDVAAGGPVQHRHLDDDLVPPRMSHVPELRSDLGADTDEIALRERRGGSSEHRALQIVERHALVVEEAPGGEDHPAAGTDERCPHPCPSLDADHLVAAVAHDVDDPVIDEQLGAVRSGMGHEVVDEGLAT